MPVVLAVCVFLLESMSGPLAHASASEAPPHRLQRTQEELFEKLSKATLPGGPCEFASSAPGALKDFDNLQELLDAGLDRPTAHELLECKELYDHIVELAKGLGATAVFLAGVLAPSARIPEQFTSYVDWLHRVRATTRHALSTRSKTEMDKALTRLRGLHAQGRIAAANARLLVTQAELNLTFLRRANTTELVELLKQRGPERPRGLEK